MLSSTRYNTDSHKSVRRSSERLLQEVFAWPAPNVTLTFRNSLTSDCFWPCSSLLARTSSECRRTGALLDRAAQKNALSTRCEQKIKQKREMARRSNRRHENREKSAQERKKDIYPPPERNCLVKRNRRMKRRLCKFDYVVCVLLRFVRSHVLAVSAYFRGVVSVVALCRDMNTSET